MNSGRGKLFVVGIGPGAANLVAPLASEILEDCDCVAGYELYLKLLDKSSLKGKLVISSGMKAERERCQKAVAAAREGMSVALISSGDPGIYAMASLALETLEEQNALDSVDFQTIPGVPALCAGAALLGAPIGHDFACVSLSDLLTPWEVIERRLRAAFAAGFVCAIYNPRSRGRPDLLKKALDTAKQYRAPSCPVGLARNISREGQSTLIAPLETFDPELADMLSLVIVGNSETRVAGGLMLTPRGYAKKYPCS